MAKSPKCPNCGQHQVSAHPETGCVLATLIQVIRERESIPEKKLRQLHTNTDVDRLWTDLGRIVDRLEDGGYQVEA